MIWPATHSSILAWEILQTEETGRLQSMGLQRLRHNWSNGTQRTHSILFEHSPWGRVTWFTPILQITLAQISLTQFFPGYLILKWKLSHAPITAAAAAAAKSLQSWPTLCDPIDGSPPGFPSLGFSRQEHWSGLPFPPPMHESEKWKWSRSVVSDFQRPHELQPTRLLRPWGFPGTEVRCHHYICTMLFSFLVSEKRMATHSMFLPGESQGQGNLVGCRLWGHTELDTTEAT